MSLFTPDPAAAVALRVALVRYGAIPEVARFAVKTDIPLDRGDRVVVETHRGVEVGQFLEELTAAARDGDAHLESPQAALLRPADPEDLIRQREQRRECEAAFAAWCDRIQAWKLQLELIDLEWTLDRSKLILYVLNERGPECTKLALQAAAAGLGVIEVQPVNGTGLVVSSGGGCGSGGCGSGGCHTH